MIYEGITLNALKNRGSLVLEATTLPNAAQSLEVLDFNDIKPTTWMGQQFFTICIWVYKAQSGGGNLFAQD